MTCDCEYARCKKCRERGDTFIRNIIDRGHLSVLEHVSATYVLVTDRGVTHELVRHRTGIAYSQESTRYCMYADGISVISDEFLDHAWLDAMQGCERAYMAKLASGQSPQIARAVLPTCLKTAIGVTANMREWRHVFELRLASAAHPQIRRLMAMVVRDLCATDMALFVEDYLGLALSILEK